MKKINFRLKNTIIILLGTLLLAVIIILFSIKTGKRENNTPIDQNKQDQISQNQTKPETYSRISVFNIRPIKLSIAIPSSWEGKYRAKEIGDTAYIEYIRNPDAPTNILQFIYYGKNAKAKENETVIFSDKNTIITYKKAISNPYQGEIGVEFDKILKTLDSIIKEIIIIK